MSESTKQKVMDLFLELKVALDKRKLEEATRWHPHTERPEPGEYLVRFWSGKMVTAKWEHTEYEPAGEWIDPDEGEALEDYDGQVVAYWRSRPAGPGEVG